MMPGLLYFLAFVVIYHNILLIISLLGRSEPGKHRVSLLMEVLMIVVAIYAIFTGELFQFVLGFGVYRLAIMLETSYLAYRHKRPASPLLPVNLLMVAGAFTDYLVESGWIFVASYLLFWVLSLMIGRKLMQQKLPS